MVIYFYTPLPLNLASNNNKQATIAYHHSVLASTPPHRFGPYPTLAILEPRWWPCQIQVLSQKLTGGGSRQWRQVGRCPPNSAQFWAENSHFSPKTAPNGRVKCPNEVQRWPDSTCGLTSPCQRALCCPSPPRFVRETAQKGAKRPENLRNVHRQPETKNRIYLGLRRSKNRF